MRCVITIVLVLILATAAAAGEPATPAGTYNVSWAQLTFSAGYDPQLVNGAHVLDVVKYSSPGPGEPEYGFVDHSTGQTVCVAWPARGDGGGPFWSDIQCTDGASGTIEWIDLPADSGFDTKSFVMDLQGGDHSPFHRWEVGKKQPATSVTFNLAPGQTVGGTVAARMTANGLGAGSYKWYLSVDGRQISYRIESSTTITFWWNTTGLVNGGHTFSARVVDAAGKAATGSVTVNVRN